MGLGTLRFFLAISVVLIHQKIELLVDGRTSVQMFFLISGFLITRILCINQNYSKKIVFYKNRLLRIFPIYFMVVFVTIFANFLMFNNVYPRSFGNTIAQLSTISVIYSVIGNFSLVSQDAALFVEYTGNTLKIVSYLKPDSSSLFHLWLVPTAWSLSLELYFYLLAPLVCKSLKKLIVIFILSLALRMGLIVIGIGLNDPWTYRFFPTELGLFVLGGITYHVAQMNFTSKVFLRQQSSLILFCILIFSLSYRVLEIHPIVVTIILIILLCLFLMRESDDSIREKAISHYLGELSFPIYLCHPIINTIIHELFSGNVQKYTVATLSVVISLCFAIVLNVIDKKLFMKVRKTLRGFERY